MSEQGARALNEWESKQILARCGLGFGREELAANLEQALAAAGRVGWPVALKACSQKLSHKSESGAVALGISGPEQLAERFGEMRRRLGEEAEGWLVSAMVAGNRELVMGVSQQPSFGPCVMLGLGGVFAEVMDDVVFRLAPIDEDEALLMMGELKAAKLLSAFRGQAPADKAALARGLAGLSRLAIQRPDIKEVDINPLIIQPDGTPVAVDALVVLEDGHDN